MWISWTKSRRRLPHFRFKNGETVQLPSSSLASVESLTVPQEQVIVMTADLKCPDGRRRVSEVLSRMGDDIGSVLVDSREKTVILSCRFGGNARKKSVSSWLYAPVWHITRSRSL
ncbi:uncharacterized protein LOC116259192 [Nymphaea colorata]|nr:uncharacterized protein LOC116259192 [Nymphaea colorata]